MVKNMMVNMMMIMNKLFHGHQDDLARTSMVNRVTDTEEEGKGDPFVSFRPLKD